MKFLQRMLPVGHVLLIAMFVFLVLTAGLSFYLSDVLGAIYYILFALVVQVQQAFLYWISD